MEVEVLGAVLIPDVTAPAVGHVDRDTAASSETTRRRRTGGSGTPAGTAGPIGACGRAVGPSPTWPMSWARPSSRSLTARSPVARVVVMGSLSCGWGFGDAIASEGSLDACRVEIAAGGRSCQLPRARCTFGKHASRQCLRDSHRFVRRCSGRSAAHDPVITLEHVVKRFGTYVAVQDANFAIERGEFFSMLGPSGCGKTTTLRMIAGFEQPTAGRILLEGKDVSRVPPYRRNVNTVFQHYALFPHMTVADNVAFGPRSQKLAADETAQRVSRAARGGPAHRSSRTASRHSSPAVSSSGSRSPARWSNYPSALLLDEPLGALDLKLRQAMQIELKRIQREVGHHVHLRDARPGRGADDVRPDRGHERRAGRADRHAAARSITRRPRSSWPTSSAWPT